MKFIHARLYAPLTILLVAILACSGPAQDPNAGHITQVGTVFQTPTSTFIFPTDFPTLEPTATRVPVTPPPPISPNDFLVYKVQTGDTLDLIALRFNVPLLDLIQLNSITNDEPLKIDEILFIPARLEQTGPDFKIMPDSETVYSLGVAGFDVTAFVNEQGGYLTRYREVVRGGTRTGAEVVQMVALDNSVSPRLLLAILEQRSGWVTNPGEPIDKLHPIGPDPQRQGLFNQLDWIADTLNLGYYRWRDNTVTAIDFPNGTQVRINPTLNAGTVAIQFLYSRMYHDDEWQTIVGPQGLYSTYFNLFGDPFAKAVEPLLPISLTQPELRLPFAGTWSYIGGPHASWLPGSPWGALDFAPPSAATGCLPSNVPVLAPVAGLVTRSGDGVVVIDLDGDGREQSGWAVVLLHVATNGRAQVGTSVETGDAIGFPSCEGGRSTGTHVHIARKFNGEWIAADGPIPFNLSGWIAHSAGREYKGTLTKGEDTVTACECSSDVSGISVDR